MDEGKALLPLASGESQVGNVGVACESLRRFLTPNHLALRDISMQTVGQSPPCCTSNLKGRAMIVNTKDGIVTFRSVTEDPDYRPNKKLPTDTDWWLDNSMADVNVRQMRQFLRHLAEHSRALL